MGQRLGDTSAVFLALLSPVFDDVLSELAAHDAIRSLWTLDTFTAVQGQLSYDTRLITSLNDTGPDYPLAIKSLRIPRLGTSGLLERVERNVFDTYRLGHTQSDGTLMQGMPRRWRIYPDETQLQLDPVADATTASYTNGVEILWQKPPAALSGSDNIVEIRSEHIPAITAGIIKHGAMFDQDNLVDRPQAIREFDLYIRLLKRQNKWEAGRGLRTHFRDFSWILPLATYASWIAGHAGLS